MRRDLTDLVIVVDRSGSMVSCRAAMQEAINSLIQKNSLDPGETRLTLVQFDDVVETVHLRRDVKKVDTYLLVPRNSTALYDAIGHAITEEGSRLAAMDEAERPALVTVVIVTDGLENASRQYTKEKIFDMITHQREVYKWQFTFLGANQDSYGESAKLGIDARATMNINPLSRKWADGAYSNITRMKAQTLQGVPVSAFYTDEETKSANE